MVDKGSSSVGKSPAYYDLNATNWDDVVATSLEFPLASNS
jgi:hypothetical protein